MRRISPVVVVGMALTACCIVLFVVRPPFMEALNNYTYDSLLKHVVKPPSSDAIAIVDLDNKSLEDFGQWPWPRYRVAKLTDRITQAGASVIAFDIVFPEKDRTSPLMVKNSIDSFFGLDIDVRGLPPALEDFDRLFAESLKNGNVVLGCGMHPCEDLALSADTGSDPGYRSNVAMVGKGGRVNHFLEQADDITVSIPALRESASVGFFNAKVDFDGIVRRNPLVWGLGPERVYPAMSLEAVRMHLGASRIRVEYDEHGITMIGLGELAVPVDRNGRLVVNYRTVQKNQRTGYMTSFPTYPAGDVLSGRVDKDVFKGKIVFVGASAVGLKDIKASPLTEYLSGVEVHATMADNMLAGDMLWAPNWMPGVHAVLILLMGTFLTVFINHGRSWFSFLVSAVVIIAAVQASLLMMEKYELVIMPVWIVFSVIVIYPVLTTIKYWQEEMQKKKVRNMFGTMVSEDVLQYLENNPESFSLTGQRTEATMFFSDIAGFTSISESLQPEKLSELLNRYLSPMTQIIMDRKGYVDKYEGDLIMAEWGVPFPTDDHAIQACLAALEQQKKLDELRPLLHEEFGHEIRVRMGVNSGVVTAGNMGSDKKFQYTVLGDAVNQAARFEPANKDYDTEIIIGEETRKAVGEEVETRLLDRLVVKGKTKPIEVYELLAVKGELDEDRQKAAALYEKGLRLHWQREWDKAEECFRGVLSLMVNDRASRLMIDRIAFYLKQPPPVGWNGEFWRESKD